MKKILMIICCLMMSLGISAQKNFVYGIYDVQTKKGVDGSYIIDLKNKKFLPDCDGGEYSDCGDMKNVKLLAMLLPSIGIIAMVPLADVAR